MWRLLFFFLNCCFCKHALGTAFILAAEDALDYLKNGEAYEQQKQASDMRALIAGTRLENIPSAAAIHMQLRQLGGRAKFLKLQAATHMQEYAATFNQAATQQGLSEPQRELRVVRLGELHDSITDSLGNAAH